MYMHASHLVIVIFNRDVKSRRRTKVRRFDLNFAGRRNP